MIAMTNILVPTDFGDAAATALDYGRNLARTFKAALHVLHVADNSATRAIMTEVFIANIQDVQDEIDLEAEARLAELVTPDDRRSLKVVTERLTAASPSEAILGYARDKKIDLILMGTHGRKGVSHLLLGSVAESVMRTAPCPVLIVRHPEREFIRPDSLEVVPRPAAPPPHEAPPLACTIGPPSA